MIDGTPVFGLEIHLQLLTKTKIFCNCRSESSSAPNTNICPVCLGLPGAMPKPNAAAFNAGIKLAIALNSSINRVSRFDRKNYFYPDLPKGYQITQHFQPLANGGMIPCESGTNLSLSEIHLEEDSGKLIHEEPFVPEDKILVDYNRAGIPLAEIVTLPEEHSIDQVISGLKNLQRLARWLKISEAEMSNGSMRVDLNISLEGYPGRSEVKNLNSFKALKSAARAEIFNLRNTKNTGEILTRGWNEKTQSLITMRKKEQLHDYRYLPEPDIFPVVLNESEIMAVKEQIGELPWELEKKFSLYYGLDKETAFEMTRDKETSDYYQEILGIDPILAAKIIRRFSPQKRGIAAERIIELIRHLQQKSINFTIAEKIIKSLEKKDISVSEIIKLEQLRLITDKKKLQSILENEIFAHRKEYRELCAGNRKMIRFFIGVMMRKTERKASPEIVKELILKSIKE